ncbi:hypothetical protein BH23CHL8_BH23CHL8_29110 [soil metagenome]
MAVIGAGIAGIGVALELAGRGVSVELHERTDRVHGRASLANEGKVHLGYIYANDPSLRTARQMVEGAWTFSPILRDWLERDLGEAALSTSFHYLAHRVSLLARDALDVMYRRIADLNREMSSQAGTGYFGRDAARPPRRLSGAEREGRFGPDVQAAWETPELAVDTEVIGEALRDRVAAEPRIRLDLGSDVISASPQDGGVSLTTRVDGATETRRYDRVVNASWEDLLRIDATAGLPVPEGASFRLRRILRVQAPHGAAGVGSCSVVLGAFGDLVEYQGGCRARPTCRPRSRAVATRAYGLHDELDIGSARARCRPQDHVRHRRALGQSGDVGEQVVRERHPGRRRARPQGPVDLVGHVPDLDGMTHRLTIHTA